MHPHFLHNDANYGVNFLNTTTYVSLLSVDCAWFVSRLYHSFIARINPKALREIARALSERALQLYKIEPYRGIKGMKVSGHGVLSIYSRGRVSLLCVSSVWSRQRARVQNIGDRLIFAPISSDSNSFFAGSYTTSCGSTATLVRTHHASVVDPIYITISNGTFFFLNGLRRLFACQK